MAKPFDRAAGDANNMKYEARFDDPSVYTRPWTFGFDMKRAIFAESNPTDDYEHYEQWEEACYEGLRDVDRSLRAGDAEKKCELPCAGGM